MAEGIGLKSEREKQAREWRRVRKMKKGIDGKDATKKELSIQDGDHDLPRLRLLASRNSSSLSLLSFTPTLGPFVV